MGPAHLGTRSGSAANARGGLPSTATPSGTVAPLLPSPPSTGPSTGDVPATSALAPDSPPFKAVQPSQRRKRPLRVGARAGETPSTAGPSSTGQEPQQQTRRRQRGHTPNDFEYELGDLVVEAAHRIVCYFAHGPPPHRCSEGGAVWHVVHLCHNKACLNPFHLCWGLSVQHNQSMLNLPLIKARVEAQVGNNCTYRQVHASMLLHEAMKETLIGGDLKAELGSTRGGHGNLLLTTERARHFLEAQAILARHLNNN